MRSLLPCLASLPLLAAAAQPAAAQVARPPQPAPCQVLTDPAVATECRQLTNGHSLMPQVVSVCGRLSPATTVLKCLHAAKDRLYALDAIDWCSRRATAEDVVQCFTLTGGPNRAPEPVVAVPSPAGPSSPATPPAAPVSPGAGAKTGVVTEISRQPLPTAPGPRGPSPEVMQPASHRPPPSTLDRVGNDVRSVVEGPGSDWLERVGRDVRGGANTVGNSLRPRPSNDPAYGPGTPAPTGPPATSPPR